LQIDGVDYPVTVTVRGNFQPIDGYYRWYGRVSAADAVSTALSGKAKVAQLSTPEGSAEGRLSDVDPWGRYRIMGTSMPPFALPDRR
jgi:hypothetical protein